MNDLSPSSQSVDGTRPIEIGRKDFENFKAKPHQIITHEKSLISKEEEQSGHSPVEDLFSSMSISGRTPTSQSLAEAVRKARHAPILRYLTGAAPVVYGIPTDMI